MVGMTNLYRYYGTHVNNAQNDTRASETFRGFVYFTQKQSLFSQKGKQNIVDDIFSLWIISNYIV